MKSVLSKLFENKEPLFSLKKLSMKNAFCLVIILLFLPFLFYFLSFQSTCDAFSGLENRLMVMQTAILKRNALESANKRFAESNQNKNKRYLEKYVAPLPLLVEEKALIETLAKNPEWSETNGDLVKRLYFLSNQRNKIHFSKEHTSSMRAMQEMTLHLSSPVEVSLSDLKTLLGRIEGIGIDERLKQERPQIIITDFEITRKRCWGTQEAYVLNLGVIQRTYENNK